MTRRPVVCLSRFAIGIGLATASLICLARNHPAWANPAPLLTHIENPWANGSPGYTPLQPTTVAAPESDPEVNLPAATPPDALQQAVAVAQALTNPEAKAMVLRDLARQYGALGQPDQAIALLAEATTAVGAIAPGPSQAMLLSDLAATYGHLGQPDLGLDLLATAVTAANGVADVQTRASLLTQLALQYGTLGQPDQATQLLSQSQAMLLAAAAPPTAPAEPMPLTPLQPTPWQGGLSLSGRLFSGDKATTVVVLSSDLRRRWARDEVTVATRVSYDFDSSRDDSTEFSGQLTNEYGRYLTDRLRYFISTGLLSDDIENLNLLVNLNTGVGVNLWRGEGDRTLDARAGLGLRYENFRDEAEDFDLLTTELGLRYVNRIFDSLTLTQAFTVGFPLADAADYRLDSQTTVAIPISDSWSFNNSLRLRYSAEPAPDNPNLLLNLESGLRYQF